LICLIRQGDFTSFRLLKSNVEIVTACRRLPSLAGLVCQVYYYQSQKAAYEANAKTQEMQALDAKRRGSIAEGEQHQRLKLVIGSQVARQGGSGVIAGQDTGADVLAETAEYGARDPATLRINALREAWGLGTQAKSDRFQGDIKSQAGFPTAAATWLSGVENKFMPPPPWWKKWDTYQPGSYMYPNSAFP
jgi:hypothetical protein